MSQENDDDDFDLVIDVNQINLEHLKNYFWMNLSANENAIDIFKNYKKQIDWNTLSLNKNAIHLLERRRNKINWNNLMQNEGATNLLKDYFDEHTYNNNHLYHLVSNESKFAMDFIENVIETTSINKINILMQMQISKNESVHAINLMKKYPKLIDWTVISSNKSAMEIIEPNLEKISFGELCENENAVSIIKDLKNKQKMQKTSEKNQLLRNFYINWKNLSKNKNAMDLLIENQDKINWKKLSKNENAVHFLKKNQDRIDWKMLSKNKSTDAIDLLKQNQNNIDWVNLAKNKNKKAIPLLMKFVKRMFVPDPPKISKKLVLPGPSIEMEESSFDMNDEIKHNRLRHMRGNDLIEMNETFVSKHILQDSNNIALVLNRDVILTNKEDIKTQILIRKNLAYECIFTMKDDKKVVDKIDENTMYCKLGNFGFPVNYSYINAKYVKQILTSKHQIYEFKETEKELESLISLSMHKPNRQEINDPELAYGASHCQEGQGGKVFIMKQIRNIHHKKETLEELKTKKTHKKKMLKELQQRSLSKKNKKKVLKELITRHRTTQTPPRTRTPRPRTHNKTKKRKREETSPYEMNKKRKLE